MTEQQLVMWARSLTFGQVLTVTALGAVALIAVALVCVAVSLMLQGGEDNAPEAR